MTKKDFMLIQDAVNEGIANFFNNSLAQHIPAERRSMIEHQLRIQLANSFGNRLRYVNDSFDKNKFETEIIKTRVVRGDGQIIA